MAKLVGIQLVTAALIGGVLRRPEEGVIPCTRDEAEGIVEAEQGEIVKLAQASDDDAAADKAQAKADAAAKAKADADAKAKADAEADAKAKADAEAAKSNQAK